MKSKELAIKNKNFEDEWKANRSLGVVAELEENLSKAESIYLENLSKAKSIKNRKLEATALMDIGNVKQVGGLLEESLNFYEEANLMFEDLKDLKNYNLTLGNIAMLQESSGQYALALESQLSVLDYFEREEHLTGMSNTTLAIANIYMYLQEWDKAFTYINRSYNYNQLNEDLFGASKCLNTIASLHGYTNNLDSSIYYFQLLENIYKDHNYLPGLFNVYINSAEAYNRKKDYHTADSLLSLIDWPFNGVDSIPFLLGKGLNSYKLNKWKQARVHLKKAEGLTTMYHTRHPFVADVHYHLAVVLHHLGEYETALIQYIKYDSIQRINHQNDIDKNIAIAESNYKFRNQKLANDQKIASAKLIRNAWIIFLSLLVFGALIVSVIARKKNKDIKQINENLKKTNSELDLEKANSAADYKRLEKALQENEVLLSSQKSKENELRVRLEKSNPMKEFFKIKGNVRAKYMDTYMATTGDRPNTIRIYTKSRKEPFEVNASLTDFFDSFPSYFKRANQKTVVNAHHVRLFASDLIVSGYSDKQEKVQLTANYRKKNFTNF